MHYLEKFLRSAHFKLTPNKFPSNRKQSISIGPSLKLSIQAWISHASLSTHTYNVQRTPLHSRSKWARDSTEETVFEINAGQIETTNGKKRINQTGAIFYCLGDFKLNSFFSSFVSSLVICTGGCSQMRAHGTRPANWKAFSTEMSGWARVYVNERETEWKWKWHETVKYACGLIVGKRRLYICMNKINRDPHTHPSHSIEFEMRERQPTNKYGNHAYKWCGGDWNGGATANL